MICVNEHLNKDLKWEFKRFLKLRFSKNSIGFSRWIPSMEVGETIL